VIENKEKLQRCKGLVRFFLGQAYNNLDQAKMQCLFIYPNWQIIQGRIQEAINMINEILETSKKSDGDQKFPGV